MPMSPAPSVSVDPGAPSVYPVCTPRPEFWLTASAHRYEVADVGGEPRLLPILNRVPLGGGLSGVSSTGRHPANNFIQVDGTPQSLGIRLAAMRESVIPSGDQVPQKYLPEGVGPGGYARKTMVRAPGQADPVPHFHEVWQVHATDGIDTEIKWDRPKYNAWRAYLVEKKLVPAPSEKAIRKLKAEHLAVKSRVETTPNYDSNVKSVKVEAAQAKIDALEKAVA